MVKQEERRQRTLQLLLDTTKDLVREKGCHAITMQNIMDKSGLSKGAIFHYVKSKDEIFVRVLQERLEETNRRFMHEIEQGKKSFEEPMEKIRESIIAYAEPHDVTNKVLMYLLGKEDDPVIAEALQNYYERSVQLSRKWIELGQQHGVIPQSVDAQRTGEMFMLITLGLRIRASIPHVSSSFTAEDFTQLIRMLLNPE